MDLSQSNFDFDSSKPTLVIAECLLPYLNLSCSSGLLKYFAKFPDCIFISFDMINPFDYFGKRMVLNLTSSYEIKLDGLLEFSSVEKMKSRFLDSSWKECSCKTMFDIWNEKFSDKERYFSFLILAFYQLNGWMNVKNCT